MIKLVLPMGRDMGDYYNEINHIMRAIFLCSARGIRADYFIW